MTQRIFSLLTLMVASAGLVGCDLLNSQVPERTFTIRIENVSTANTLMTSQGTKLAIPLSPGVWAVHAQDGPLFNEGRLDRGKGLEALAEDGNPALLAAALQGQPGIVSSGLFNTPAGATAPGALGPGQAYEFTVTAKPGMRLSLATMFVQSNDLFYAPGERGLPLFDVSGKPIQGDVTNRIQLWDAGTEKNQEPGLGPDQAPRQPGPNIGTSESNPVGPVNDGFTYPDVSAVIRVTIVPKS